MGKKIYRVWTGYGKYANRWISTDFVEEEALNLYINTTVEKLRSRKWNKQVTFYIDDVGIVQCGEKIKTSYTIVFYTSEGKYEYNYKTVNCQRTEPRKTIIIKEI